LTFGGNVGETLLLDYFEGWKSGPVCLLV